MPKWYRLNTSGQWSPLKLYRLNTSGTWDVIKKAYRLNTSGNWDLVHTTQDVPVATTSPTLTNQSSSTTNFYGGDTLTLTRGAYTNTTANSDTTYRMTIYKGLNSSLSLSDTNWEVASRTTYTGANSTSSTSITYSLTDTDAKLGYYLVGEVRVNNDANTAGSSNYDFETASRILSRISFSVTNLTVSPTSYGGGFSWTISGVADSTFIYDQTLVIRLLNSGGAIKKTVSIAPGTTSVTVSDSTNLSPSTTYYAEIQVTANDGWKTSGTPNRLTANTTFNTLSAPPANTVAPTISPLNGRTPPSGYLGYLPVSTTLTANKGTWANTDVNTTYSYNWFIEDSTTGSLQSTGFIGDTQTYSTADVGDYIFVNVRATNSDGSLGTASSGSYILNQAVAVSNVTPTTATTNVSTNFSFSISHYPTSYIIDWGDGTSDSYSVSANTSTVNQTIAKTYTSTGVKTITITAQPGSKTSSTSITVSAPAPTGSGLSRSDATITPSQPSTLSFSSSSNQVTTSWTNGSPITSVQFQASGAGVSTNYTDTSAPFITSDVSNYFSSAIYSATVTNYNNDLQINVSWNQANAQSYRITYNSSTLGQDFVNGNSSASSVSVNIPWSSVAGAFSLTSVNLYSGLDQSGTSASLGGIAGTVTPTIKSSSRSGSTLLTYTPPAPVNTSIPTLSPTSISVGTVLTAGVGTWSNSPTSYDIRIYRGTAGVLMSETLVASGSGTTLTYTITQADYDSGQRYFRTYVNASNAGGSSGFVAGQERGPTQLPNVAPSGGTASIALTSGSGYPGSVYTLSKVDATGTPTPTVSWIWRRADGGVGGNSFTGGSIIQTGGTTYTATTSDGGYSIRAEVTWSNGVSPNQVVNTNSLVVSAFTVPGTVSSLSASSLLSGTNLNWSASWSAPSNTGGQTITGYRVYVERGSSSTGPWTATATQIPAGTTSPTYTAASPYSTTSTSVSGRVINTTSTWIRVYVAAVNASGVGSYATAVG